MEAQTPVIQNPNGFGFKFAIEQQQKLINDFFDFGGGLAPIETIVTLTNEYLCPQKKHPQIEIINTMWEANRLIKFLTQLNDNTVLMSKKGGIK